MELHHLHSHIGALRELKSVGTIPAEAENVHIELYYYKQHPAVPEVPDEKDDNGNVVKKGTPGKEAWGEPFHHQFTSLPVSTANEIVAALDKLISDKVGASIK
jgi:hypothetical protein